MIFVPFTHTIKILSDYLTKVNISNEIINGSVPVGQRTAIFRQFQEQDNPRVLIIQPQAAAHGVTLTAANVIIWYSPVSSSETYLQANARINRQGQKNSMTIVHIKGSSIEERMYNLLQSKLDVHTKLIDLYENEIKNT